MSDKKNQILIVLSNVPYGKVTSYGAVAKMAGLPGHARMVGHVLKNLPEETTIPWHRVVNSQYKISFPVGSDKYISQEQLLKSESIAISNGKVKDGTCVWQNDI